MSAISNIEERINNLLGAAETLLSLRPQEAQDSAFYALHLSDSIKNELLIGLSNKFVGIAYVKMHFYNEAIPYLQESLKLLKIHNQPRDICLINLNLGRAYRENDAYILAEKALKDCIESASAIGDTALLGETYYMLTKVYRKKSDFVSGLESCIKCLEIADKTNNESLQAGCENEMGHVLLSQGNIEDALRYYNYALQKKLAINDSSGIADTYISIGNAYRESNKNVKAIDYYRQASSYIPKAKYQPNVFNIPFNMGIAYYNLHQFNQAKRFFLESIDIARSQNSQSNIANVKIWQATVFLDEENYQRVHENLDEALRIAKEIGSMEIEKNAYLGFHNLYLKTNRYELALHYYKDYTSSLNNILDEENSQMLDEMRIIYESERQGLEINELQNKVLKQELDNTQLTNSRNRWLFIAILALTAILTGAIIVLEKRKGGRLLAEKNKELQNVIQKLEESIQTKDKLFSIIAHDLSNPFNSILGFSELMIADEKPLTRDQTEKYGRSIHSSAAKAYNLLQNLLSWSRLQLGKFEVRQVESQLTLLVEKEISNCYEIAQNKNISIENHVDSSIFIKVDVSMLSIAVRNLITNAIKFSPVNSKVIVKSDAKEKNVNVIISDSGVGIPKEKLNKLFSFSTNTSTPGTEGEKGTGLGLVLCYELIKLNKGNIQVESKPGKTDFTISLPVA